MKKHFLLIALICSIFVACGPKPELPTVATVAVDYITENSASCAGEVVDDGNADIITQGFCWSTEQNPTLHDNVVEGGYTELLQREKAAPVYFSADLSGLLPSTEYYVRAYATNSEGTAYGENVNFVTLEGVSAPAVKTSDVTEITSTTALCGGEVVSDGNATVTARGVCWSTKQNPTINDMFTSDGEGVGTFASTLDNLTANTTYYVRAYATNSEGTNYGEEKSFMTMDPYNGHEYVDMGFQSGVKWATCNVGATTPEGYGEHYAWGEIATKETYEIGSCTTYGQKLDSISGNPEYDAASAQWGGNWRTPRLEDMYELVTQCEWIWAGNGFNVVSKINGNYIFLPAAGFMNTPAAIAGGTEGVLDQGRWGYYWTSTPYDEKYTNKEACSLLLSSGGYQTEVALRYNGFSIRPVID